MSDDDQQDEPRDEGPGQAEVGPGVGGPRFGPVGGESGRQEVQRLAAPTADKAEARQADGAASKDAAGSESPWPDRDEHALPETYGEDVVVALVRDPWWVFVYWELSPDRRAGARQRAGEGAAPVLRLLEVEPGQRVVSEVEVPDVTVGDWYVQVTAPQLRIRAEYGFRAVDGEFHSVFASEPTAVPQAAPELPEEGPELDLFEASAGLLEDAPHVPEDVELAPGDDARERRSEAAWPPEAPEGWVAGPADRDDLGPFVWFRTRGLSGSGIGLGFKLRPPQPVEVERRRKPGAAGRLGPVVARPGPTSPTSPLSPFSGRPSSPGGPRKDG